MMHLTQKMMYAGTLLAAATFLTATPASGVLIKHNGNVLVADDLQGHTVGALPGSPWNVNWVWERQAPLANTVQPSGNATFQVTNVSGGSFPGVPTVGEGGVAGHTDYLWGATGTGTNIDRVFAAAMFTPVDSGALTVEFLLYAPQSDSAELRLESGPLNQGDDARTGSVMRLTPTGHDTTGDSVIDSWTWANSLTDGGGGDTGAPILPGQWVHYVLEFTFNLSGDNTVQLTGNGVTGGAIPIASAGINQNGPIQAFAVLTPANGVEFFIASVVPEPASVALMGLGGLMLLRRRRIA